MFELDYREISKQNEFFSFQNKVSCGAIELLKNEWLLLFQCNVCGKQQKSFKIFIEHSLSHILEIEEHNLSELIIKALEPEEETINSNSFIQNQDDDESRIDEFKYQENAGFLDAMKPIIKLEENHDLECYSPENDFTLTNKSTKLKPTPNEYGIGTPKAEVIDTSVYLDSVDSVNIEENNHPQYYTAMHNFSSDAANDSMAVKSETTIDLTYNDNSEESNDKLLCLDNVPVFPMDSVQSVFNCDMCEKTFSLQSHLELHRKRFHSHSNRQKYFSCNECQKQFRGRHSLKAHIERLHSSSNKKVVCDICASAFGDEESLRIHISQRHLGLRAFACHLCDSRFTKPSDLLGHMTVHTNERPYACPLCDSTFKHKCNLRSHLKCHSEVRQYVCDLCPKSYKRQYELTTHRRAHFSGKRFECDVCCMTFPFKSLMRDHRQKHFSNTEQVTVE